jgi:hypothetical protein
MVFNFGFVGAGGRSEIYTTLGERRNGRLVAEVWPMADFSDMIGQRKQPFCEILSGSPFARSHEKRQPNTGSKT